MPIHRSFEVGLRLLGLYLLVPLLPGLCVALIVIPMATLQSSPTNAPGPTGLGAESLVTDNVIYHVALVDLVMGVLLLFAPRRLLALPPLRRIVRANAKLNRNQQATPLAAPLLIAQLFVATFAAWHAVMAYRDLNGPFFRVFLSELWAMRGLIIDDFFHDPAFILRHFEYVDLSAALPLLTFALITLTTRRVTRRLINNNPVRSGDVVR
jgi:hypothetical protein